MLCCLQHLVTEGNATRVQVELYRETKRNGAARSLRAALTRFAQLCSLIRPNKSRSVIATSAQSLDHYVQPDMDKCLLLKLLGHPEKANHPAVVLGFSQTGGHLGTRQLGTGMFGRETLGREMSSNK